jgi:hypothetical protein
MTALQLKKQTSVNNAQALIAQLIKNGDHARHYLSFKQSENLQSLRDCLSFTAFDFENIQTTFQRTNTSCALILADCLAIIQSAMCTIAKASRGMPIDYQHARDVFLMTVLASQTAIDECVKNLGTLDADAKHELNDIYQSLALSIRSLVH